MGQTAQLGIDVQVEFVGMKGCVYSAGQMSVLHSVLTTVKCCICSQLPRLQTPNVPCFHY